MRGEMQQHITSEDRDIFIGQHESETAAVELKERAEVLEARRIDALAEMYGAAQESRVEDFLRASDAVESLSLQLAEQDRKLRQAKQSAELLARISATKTTGRRASA